MGYREKWFNENISNHGWYKCSRCGKSFRKDGIDIDHIIPQNYHGPDWSFNLQSMCKHCNRSKKDSLGFDTFKDLFSNIFK